MKGERKFAYSDYGYLKDTNNKHHGKWLNVKISPSYLNLYTYFTFYQRSYLEKNLKSRKEEIKKKKEGSERGRK